METTHTRRSSKGRVKELIEAISASIRRISKRKGYRLVDGSWGVSYDKDKQRFVPCDVDDPSEEGAMCALAMVVVDKQPQKHKVVSVEEAAAKALCVPKSFVGQFVNAFDGEPDDPRSDGGQVGVAIRKEFRRRLPNDND